ncbi:NAD(P)-dependent oxidoreductase [Nonomuraea sp. NPDC049655]|uniref:NAD(P)-dependent oxidoreductase n=1 Tax=Nonomuraea sp. NPDC049655 TaxID=3364355 RepID=UPI0037B1D21D
MKLTVFGAGGGVGRQLLVQSLAQGHDVTAVVRDPARLDGLPVRVVPVADLTTAEAGDLRPAVEGADAVLSALGPPNNAAAGVASRGTKAILAAMEAAGARRLVVVSAAPVGTTPSPGRPNPPRHDPGDGPFLRYVVYPLVKAALRPQYLDLAVMEDAVRDSGLDWTVVRPVQLTDKPLTGAYRTAVGQNVPGGRYVSRADVAHAMLAALDRPETVRQVIGMAD